MRIRTKLISVYLGIAILFSLIGFYTVQYTAYVGELFEVVESDSVPSLTALMEIIAATRQASIKAMEYSRRGKIEDRAKALKALHKIQDGLDSYKMIIPHQGLVRLQNLEVKTDSFIHVIKDYLSLGTGPGLAELVSDVDRLHEYRSNLIRAANVAIQNDPGQLELALQSIKSEARKVSIKAVEFALDGDIRSKIKAEEALVLLSKRLTHYKSKHKTNNVYRQQVIKNGETYVSTSHQYLKDITASESSIKDIQDMEKYVHQIRRDLIHVLYPLIEQEKQDLHKAATETNEGIATAVNILVISIAGVVVIALIAGVLIGQSITKPLQKLNEAAQQVAKGDLEQGLNIKSSDEIGELASGFNYMKQELKKHYEKMDELVKERTLALENSNKELESYSYSIAHDLRAPLRSIIGFSQIVLEDASDKLNSEDKGHLQRIIKSATHMADLIDDILELSRMSRTNMEYKEVNLSKICIEISKTFSALDSERKVDWCIEPDLKVNCDRRLLYLVLSNLLANAWKFTQNNTQTKIEFGFMNDNGENVYYVRDNGVGFDMQYADKLFGLFQRMHSADEYEGTGVGLATVQRIIHRHNGWVRADSEKGKGTTIYFSIPGRKQVQ